MASPVRIFLAGVGTTFAILAVGFGGGVLMTNSTLSGTSAQKHVGSEPLAAARIVHPNSAEPALQVAASVPTEPTPAPQLATQAAADPAVAVTAPSPNLLAPAASASQSPIEERSKTRRELRAERRQRYAERRAFRHRRQLVSPDQREPGIVAFDGDASQPRTGFFGN